MTIEAPSLKELWKEAAFLQGIPHTCPVDGSATRFGYKEPGAFKYWVLFSTGPTVFEFKFGQDTASGELFPGSYDKAEDKTHYRWTHWDWKNKQEIVAWEDGQITEDGKRLVGGQPATNGNGNGHSKAPKQPAPEFTMDDVPEMATTPAKRTRRTVYDDILADPAVTQSVVEYVELMRTADSSAGASEKKHNYAVRIVDEAVGKGNHRAALSALLGREVNAQSPISEGAFKEVLKLTKTLYEAGQPVKNQHYSAANVEALRDVYAWAIGEYVARETDIPF